MKRFYKQVAVKETPEGFTITLDGRSILTPAKAAFIIPTDALAKAVTDEWNAQGEEVLPSTMPMMRLCSTTLDRVRPHRKEIVEMIAAYGGNDLLCYRAAPEQPGLSARQQAQWSPLLGWVAETLNAPLKVTEGIAPLSQPVESLRKLGEAVGTCDDFTLTALHEFTVLTGSLVLGLAVQKGRLMAEEAFDLGHLEEDWQVELWGQDEEAAHRREHRLQEMREAARFFSLLNSKKVLYTAQNNR